MAEKTKAPSKNHKWDAKNKRWVLKTFEERQKGRNILLQGKNNPIRVVHDTIRNVNAAKEVRKKDSLKTNNKSNNTKSNTKKPMATWRVDSKENAKLQEQFKKGEKQTYKKAGSKQTDQHKKAESTTSGKKKITTRSRMEARNREIHGDDKIDALKEKHRKWKADRKAKTEAKKNKLKATQGKSMPSNPKGMRQEGVGKTAKDLTRHTKKKKKSFGEKLAASFD